MLRKISFLLLIIINSCSYENEMDRINFDLTDGNKKVWVLSEYTPSNGVTRKETKRVITFDVKFRYMEFFNEKSVLLQIGQNSDVVPINRWSFKNDTTITLNNYDYTILLINKDTLKLKEHLNNDQFLYIRSDSVTFIWQ